MNLIAVMGKAKCGKDTIASEIVASMDGRATKLAFADKPKRVMMDLYGLSHDDVYTEEGKARVTDFDCWKCPGCNGIECIEILVGREAKIECKTCTAIGDKDAFRTKWTVRMMMQFFMSDYAQRIDPLVWVRPALARAQEHLKQQADVVVITDCRFRREAEAVWKAGGEVWRIRRPATDRVQVGLPGHASEVQMDEIPDSMFQVAISNGGTLDQLRGKVKDALARFRNARHIKQA